MKTLEARLADYRQVLDAVEPRSTPAARSARATKSARAAGAARFRHRQRITLAVAASVLFVTGVVATGVLLVNHDRSQPTPPTPAPAAGINDSTPTLHTSVATTPTTAQMSPPTIVHRTNDPTTVLDVFAIGDSVMVAAAADLSAAGVWVDATENRQASADVDILEQAVTQDLVGDVVVIHIGTNGPINQEQMDRLMRAVSAIPIVVILTVKADVAWTDGNNALIRALPALYPNVTVVDWEAAATANPHLLYADHVHLKGRDGEKFYANLILEALGRDLIS